MKFATLLLTCLSISAYSQDYLVTNKGDTLRGQLNPLYFDKLDRVQIKQNKKKTIFTALQVRELSFKGELYNPMRFDNTIRFMKLLKAGYLSLYAFRVENQVTYGGRFLAKKDGSTMEVPTLVFKKKMAGFLADCPELEEKITSGTYGRNDLDKIIDGYNTYIDSNTQDQKTIGAANKKTSAKLLLLESLRKTVEGQPDFDSKKNALDLMNDMVLKLRGGQGVPNYMIDGLKEYLSGVEAAQGDLEKFTATLKE